MAIIFEMWVECATDADCLRMAAHFNGLKFTLVTGRSVTWGAAPLMDNPTALVVSSGDLSQAGVRTVQDAVETTESGLRLYHHLKRGPAFRFARAAWEAETLPMVELHDYTKDYLPGERHVQLECALDDALYKEIGSPRNCFPYREGYQWTRYSGEIYKPLYSCDSVALNECCRSLFPEYFSSR